MKLRIPARVARQFGRQPSLSARGRVTRREHRVQSVERSAEQASTRPYPCRESSFSRHRRINAESHRRLASLLLFEARVPREDAKGGTRYLLKLRWPPEDRMLPVA